MTIVKNKVLRFLLVFIFSLVSCFTLFACAPAGDPGDPGGPGDGGEGYFEPDYSSNNPEYVRFRDVINIITKTYGFEVSTGATNTLVDPSNNQDGYNGGDVYNAYSKTTTFEEIRNTAKTYLDSLKTKEPDTSYNDAAIVFDTMSMQCFKMPVYMGELITQYMGATSIYNKTMLVGHDRADEEDVYYRIEQYGGNLISYAYTKNGFDWEGETPTVTDNYYMYYTEVDFVDENNFSFVCVTASEDSSFTNLMYGDNNCNLLHINIIDDSVASTEVYYTYGDMFSLRCFDKNSEILTQAYSIADNIASKADIDYLNEIAADVSYQISHENFEKVLNRINNELGYGSSSENNYDALYPGWRISDTGVVEGYYGENDKFCDLEVLEIPSEFTKIANDFIINGSVDKLIIPSTISTVMAYDYASNDYTAQKTVKDFSITCRSAFNEARTTHAIKEIEIKEINEQESNFLSIGSDKNLYSKDGSTLLYICDTPDTSITEYNFAGKQLGRNFYWIENNAYYHFSDGAVRENFSNIKKLSIDAICVEDHNGIGRRFPVLDFFVEVVDNFYLEELNIHNFNEITDEKENLNYFRIDNQLSTKEMLDFNIEELNIYGNVEELKTYSSKINDAYIIARMESPTLDNDVETLKSQYQIYNSYDLTSFLENPRDYLKSRDLIMSYEEYLMSHPNMEEALYEVYVDQEISNNIQKIKAKFVKDYLNENPKASLNYWENVSVPSGCELNSDITTELTTDLITSEQEWVSPIREASHRNYPQLQEVNITYGDINPKFEFYDIYKTVDLYLSSAIVSLSLRVDDMADHVLTYIEEYGKYEYQKGTSLFVGTVNESNPVLKLHLPWTKETFYNTIVKNGNNWIVSMSIGTESSSINLKLEDYEGAEYINGLKLIFAETDDTTRYSFYIYDTTLVYNENTDISAESEEVLLGYYTNDSTLTTLTLPDSLTKIPSKFRVYAPNITKLVIPNTITEIIFCSSWYHYEHRAEVTTFNPTFKDPYSLEEYILQEIEVEEGSTLLKTSSNGMKLESFDGKHLLYLCDQAVEILDLRYITIPTFVYISDEYGEDSATAKSELYVNLATTLKTVNIYYVFELMADVYYIEDVSYYKTGIKFSYSFQCAYERLMQCMKIENVYVYNISLAAAIVENPDFDIYYSLRYADVDPENITEYSIEELLQEGFVIDLNIVILSQYVENVYLYGDGFTVGDTFNHINNVYINGNLQE